MTESKTDRKKLWDFFYRLKYGVKQELKIKRPEVRKSDLVYFDDW